MTSIQTPLSSDAVRAADDEIYARHANDPRPNALYDAQGNRLPLDPVDPSQEALREEWRQLYAAALAAEDGQPDGGDGSGGGAPDEPEPPEGNRPVDDPVEPCPYDHWLDVTLLPVPDQASGRPPWWPPRTRGPYQSEHVSTNAPVAVHLRQLNGAGNHRWGDIPAGAYDVVFWRFYHEIDDQLFKEIGG